MTYSYSIIPKALRELDHEIAYSKKRWGAKHARSYKQELLSRIRTLVKNPKVYSENPDLGKGLRSLRHKGNYIIYAIDEDKKQVVIIGFPSIYKNNS